MTIYKITAPVEGVNSTVAGVCIRDSVAETNSEGAIAYFRRHGYQVEQTGQGPERKAPARFRKQASPKAPSPDGPPAGNGEDDETKKEDAQ